MSGKSVAVLSVISALFLTACASVPAGPSVMVLPGAGKGFEQFQADDAVCRQWALQQSGTTPKRAATQSAVSGAAIGTAVGAAAGAVIGAASGNPATGAAIGAGGGLLAGTAVGAGSASASGTTAQGRYDMAYQQCMYAKGNQIPIARGSLSNYASPPPPPPPTAPAPVAPPPPPGAVPPPGAGTKG